MTDTRSHLSAEKQLYWRMRGAYEDRYNRAGRSILGLAISTDQSSAAVARNTEIMGFLASWEKEGISQKPYFDLERPAGDVLVDTITTISDRWEEKYKPIGDEGGRYDLALDLARRGAEGKITDTKDFKQLLHEGERALLGMQPDRISLDEVRVGHEALRQVSQGILQQNPIIKAEMTAESRKENDELLSTLNETDLDSGRMDIFKMSLETGRHPAEVVGMGLALGILSDDYTGQVEPFLTEKGRIRMTEAAQMPRADLYAEITENLSKSDLGPVGRTCLAAVRKSINAGASDQNIVSGLAYTAESSGMFYAVNDGVQLKILAAQGSLSDEKKEKVKSAGKGHAR